MPAPATAARPEKATRKDRQTDEAFREAARLVFARDGYLNAKISDIAAAAGRSVASFYNYYATKAEGEALGQQLDLLVASPRL